MADERKRILWADDEIEHLRPHMKFLEDRGFRVDGVTNGEDAIAMVGEAGGRIDLVILDEMMPGIGGLETLRGIKERNPYIPVIMVTKSEDEGLIDAAIRQEISNYLVKPVNPLQVYTVAKQLLEGKRIRESAVMRDYVQEFTVLRNMRSGDVTPDSWLEVHRRLAEWDNRLDNHRDAGLLQTHEDAKSEANVEFCQYIANHYEDWVQAKSPDDRPTLSVDIVSKYVAPRLEARRKVYFVIVDCLRLDQWLAIEPLLEPYFDIQRDYVYSILPTATSFARNSIFSGMFPLEMSEKCPQYWSMPGDDETSLNRFERQLLDLQLDRLGIKLNPSTKYIKVFNQEEASAVKKDIASLYSLPLVALVFNFVDILSHGRSESELLQEIAPDEAAFRALTTAWFKHSAMFEILKAISKQDATVVLTTDHGSVLARRSTVAYGNRDTSTNLRFKIGTNLGCDEKNAVHLKDPGRFMLPSPGLNTHYILAKENYYFVYPTRYHEYERQYRNSFQHGGISMEEMILPCVVMNPR